MNEFYREVEECEDAKIKSQNRSLKTFLSHVDADECVASHPTEVRFHHIERYKFWFHSTTVVYKYCVINYFKFPQRRGMRREGGAGAGAMFPKLQSCLLTLFHNKNVCTV